MIMRMLITLANITNINSASSGKLKNFHCCSCFYIPCPINKYTKQLFVVFPGFPRIFMSDFMCVCFYITALFYLLTFLTQAFSFSLLIVKPKSIYFLFWIGFSWSKVVVSENVNMILALPTLYMIALIECRKCINTDTNWERGP